MAEAVHRRVLLLIELCWLAAVVFTPLYFNIFSSRIFEPDKIALLRSLAVVAGALVIFDNLLVRPKGLRQRLRNPLVWSVAALAAVNVVSTAWAVAPYVSLLGSYQRLQGVYSLLSYITIGATIYLYLGRPEQLSRLKFFIIATAVPISIYGILQHFNLDPVGWKGNVSFRVSSTLGNPIFLAAYLILVIPVALSQLYNLSADLLSRVSGSRGSPYAGRLLAAVGLLVLQNVVLYLALQAELAYLKAPLAGQGDALPLGPWWMMPVAIAIFLACGWMVTRLCRSGGILTVAAAIGSGVSLMLMLAAVFLSQSRGPWLGLGAGLLAWTVGMLLMRGRKGWAVVAVWSALGLAVILAVFNLPNSPMASLRTVPYVGRLGQLTETQTGTGRVRLLIWQGALQLALREPLRAVVGYGPDTMFYVFGRVYPPDLAHFEARNAIPDRAHNALLDALVNTGLGGLLALLGVFIVAVRVAIRGLRSMPEGAERVLVLGLGSALVGHFVEIQTGIQIAATWLYFFVFVALIGVLVYGGYLPVSDAQGGAAVLARRSLRSSLQGRQAKSQPVPLWMWLVITAMAVIVGWMIWTTNFRLIAADMYLQLGQGVAAGGRLDIALKAYTRASEIAPDQGYYRFAVASGAIELARKASSQREQDEYFTVARDELREAARLEPLNADHPANLARLLRLWGSLRHDSSMLEEAIRWTEMALELSPHNAQLWDELAIGHSMLAQTVGTDDRERWMRSMGEAQQAFQRSVELDAVYAATFIYQGDYYYRPQGEAAAACSSYARALSLDAGSLALDNRAEDRIGYCKANGDLQPLASALLAYVQRHPDSFQANNTLGFVFYHMGRLQESMAYFQRAAKLAPDDFNAHKNLAIVYSDTGRYSDALKELNLAISLAPQEQAGQLQSLLPYLRSKAGQ